MNVQTRLEQSIAYLKAPPSNRASVEMTLAYDDQPVVRPIFADLHVCYLIDCGDHYDYVQNRDLKATKMSVDELHEVGLRNLKTLVVTKDGRVRRHGSLFGFSMGGDFDASVLLLDEFWEREFRPYVQGDYAAVVPSRDVLAFCDAESQSGIHELREVINRLWPGGDHLISDHIYIRRKGTWTPYDT